CFGPLSVLFFITVAISLMASDGREFTLPCRHPSAASNEYIFWYQQFPNQGPNYIVSGLKGETESDTLHGVSLIVAEDRKSSTLHFSRVTLKDSAIYFCALSDTVQRLGASAVQEPSPEYGGEQLQWCKAAKPLVRRELWKGL
uniref:Ig-like domain-containing protein n=1 Tax=Varanus komodoensis TaxID=61221 RepID=A0A8D2L857_VARKO